MIMSVHKGKISVVISTLSTRKIIIGGGFTTSIHNEFPQAPRTTSVPFAWPNLSLAEKSAAPPTVNTSSTMAATDHSSRTCSIMLENYHILHLNRNDSFDSSFIITLTGQRRHLLRLPRPASHYDGDDVGHGGRRAVDECQDIREVIIRLFLGNTFPPPVTE